MSINIVYVLVIIIIYSQMILSVRSFVYKSEAYLVHLTSCLDKTRTLLTVYVCCIFSFIFISDMCPPGTFSNTGLMPCSPCPRGQYQALSGSQTCLSCVSPNFTISSGSTSESSCHCKHYLNVLYSVMWFYVNG